MPTRIAIAQSTSPGLDGNKFLLAWPWANDPARLTDSLAAVIQHAVGGAPFVLIACGATGNRSFYGAPEHTAIAATLNFKTIRWLIIDVDDDPSSGQRHLLAA